MITWGYILHRKPVKFLGIYVGKNYDKCEELNWDGKMLKIEKTLDTWEN